MVVHRAMSYATPGVEVKKELSRGFRL